MISDRLLDAVERGEVGRARALVVIPPTARAVPLMQSVQKAAWDHGRAQGLETAARVGTTGMGENPSPARIARLAARERRRAAFKADGVENTQAHRQAREIMRSFRAALREQLGQEVSTAKASRNPDGALRDMRTTLERLRAGQTQTPEVEALLKGVERQARDTMATPILEVDWETSHRGEIAGWRAAEVLILAEFGAVLDDATTPVCRFLEGGVMSVDDPRIDHYQPMLHYGCRSRFVAMSGDSGDLNWDKGSPPRSRIKVPSGAPNIPPAKSIGEWM